MKISLSDKKGSTQVVLEHKAIPDNEFEGIEKGWKDYYFGPMKDYLENV